MCWSLSRFTEAEIFLEAEAVRPVPGASPGPTRGLTDEGLPADGRGPVTGSRVGKEAAGRRVAMILLSQAGTPSAATENLRQKGERDEWRGSQNVNPGLDSV